jgi:hypothetical protein
MNYMKTKEVPTNSGCATTEGDELYYEARGQGQPLLMIPGGGGDGGSYSLVAKILSREYRVIAYDRRANARSTMNDPQNFEVSQQSRDAVAVLRAAGETSAFAASLVLYVAILILTLGYFLPRDLILFTWSIPDHLEQIRAVSAQWSYMNWLRSLLGLAGVLTSFKGLDTYYAIRRKVGA